MLVALTTGVERASTVFGVLELVALTFLGACLVVGLAWWLVPASRSTLRGTIGFAHRWGLWAGFVVAAVCTGGSLWLSEIGGLPPCRMCWFQRICMYPLTVLLGLGAARRDRHVAWYALPLAVVGVGLSTYHYLLEHIPSLESGSGCEALNPCSIIWFQRFGFATIPFMAGTGFVTIATLLGLAATGGDSGTVDAPPLENA